MINLLRIQKDLYNAIKKLGYTVVDEATIKTKCPYVKIGYSTVQTIDIKQKSAYNMMQYIDIYSDYQGSKEVKEIAYNIYDNLNNLNLSTDDYTVNSKLYHMEFLEEENVNRRKNGSSEQVGKYRHGILIYKINVYE